MTSVNSCAVLPFKTLCTFSFLIHVPETEGAGRQLPWSAVGCGGGQGKKKKKVKNLISTLRNLRNVGLKNYSGCFFFSSCVFLVSVCDPVLPDGITR